jgi:hypothetical protein
MDTNVTLNDQAQKAAYIESLELPGEDPFLAALRDGPMMLADDTEGGAVAAGALVSFVAGLSKTHKEDVLNSTLLAQLAASKAWSREEQPTEWYDEYRDVLENLGWVVPNFDFSKYNATSSQVELDTVVLEVLAPIATGPEVTGATAVLKALKTVAQDAKPCQLWEEQTNDRINGNFQISTCVESDGNVAMSLGTFYFKAVQIDLRFLWFEYSASTTEIYTCARRVVLDGSKAG